MLNVIKSLYKVRSDLLKEITIVQVRVKDPQNTTRDFSLLKTDIADLKRVVIIIQTEIDHFVLQTFRNNVL